MLELLDKETITFATISNHYTPENHLKTLGFKREWARQRVSGVAEGQTEYWTFIYLKRWSPKVKLALVNSSLIFII
jgi:hypothetical protein